MPFAPVVALVAATGPGWVTALAGHRRRGLLRLLEHDPLVALSFAVALSVLGMLVLDGPVEPWPAVVLTTAFVALQLLLTRLSTTSRLGMPLRFGLVFAYVPLAGYAIDPGGSWPVNALMIPTVALAAATWSKGLQFVIGVVAILLVIAFVPGAASVELSRRLVALSMASAVTAFGSRRVVDSLGRSRDRLRRAQTLQRRRARQLAALEAVGTILAVEGATPKALDSVVGLLVDTFGYRYPSIYLFEAGVLRLGAQRNYASPIDVFPIDRGVIGRVARTREVVFLPDISMDPDYVSADNGVISEISLPLLGHDELLGVLNAETAGPARFDLDDLATMKIVADRLSVSLALGRERQKLTERAGLMDGLVEFSRSLGGSLDPGTVRDLVAAGAALVIRASKVGLILRDPEAGEYRVVHGSTEPGTWIEPGVGVSGRAILERMVVTEDHLERRRFARPETTQTTADTVAAMSAPLIAEDRVIGALTWARADLDPFSDQEREVAGLLAGQAALAVTNAELHHNTEQAAVTDGLTGLSNRRFFDAAMGRAEAARAREPEDERRPCAAIMFDLDLFGQINKFHGHQVGDRILRAFADVLRARLRVNDLVARYGGEEFVAVLDGATRIEAMRIAEEVRESFGGVRFGLPDGAALGCTVSAGCSALLPDETAWSVVIQRADVGLAMAKSSGRNRVVAA